MIKGMQEVIDVMTKAKADLDKNGGLKQVIFVACGGSFASSYPARFLLNQESSIRGDLQAAKRAQQAHSTALRQTAPSQRWAIRRQAFR